MRSGLEETIYIYKEDLKRSSIQYPENDADLILQILKIPSIVSENTDSIREIQSKLDSIICHMGNYSRNTDYDDGYMDAKAAAAYLGMSPTTFDKYRYNTKIKIKGYKLDGKVWYKKSDLDLFMLTYHSKSQGLA
jgi:hypothetical protein